MRQVGDVHVSVLLPVGGDAPYLQTCLLAVTDEVARAGQAGLTCEIVVVLDRPTGETRRACEQWAARAPNVHLVHSSAPGLAATLNHGLEYVSGAYTARIDSDDLMLPDRLARQVQSLGDNNELVMVGGQMHRMCGERVLSTTALSTNHDDIVGDLLAGRHAVNHSSVMIRTDALRRLGGYWTNGVGEDWDLYLRLSGLGRLANLPTAVTAYRFHAGSINGQQMTSVREGIELAVLNYERQKSGQPSLARDDLTWRRFPQRKLRAKRSALSQIAYRKSLCDSSRMISRSLYLAAAGLLAPGVAINRIRAELQSRRSSPPETEREAVAQERAVN